MWRTFYPASSSFSRPDHCSRGRLFLTPKRDQNKQMVNLKKSPKLDACHSDLTSIVDFFKSFVKAVDKTISIIRHTVGNFVGAVVWVACGHAVPFLSRKTVKKKCIGQI